MGSLPENNAKQELNDSGCVQDAPVSETYRGQAQLLDLSDDVLLCILKKCHPRDLKALGFTCPRLGFLVCDRTLWTRVDARAFPTGQERLRWFLDHGVNSNTQELQLSGYVNRQSRCLGIQDLTSHAQATPVRNRNSEGSVDVEHFLLRMWYPHLPRYAMSPRWPDKMEQADKAYFITARNSNRPLSPLSQLASEIVEDVTGSSHSKSVACNTDPQSDEEASSSKNKEEWNEALKCPGPQFTLNKLSLRCLNKKCHHLTTFVLEYCNLDFRHTNLRHFPTSLTKLSLKGTRCFNLPLNASFLGKIQDRLPLLEYLDVSECEWFEPASLMPISKLMLLKNLYMKNCTRLTECVAYASLATRYGFQHLRYLDVRGSPIADSEVSAFGWLPVLEELYIAPPSDMKEPPEHTHEWNEEFVPFYELEPWEDEEPDYFRCKPCSGPDDDDDIDTGDDKISDVMIGNYTNCERRIIVIHPNRPNEAAAREGNEENDQEAPPAPPRPVPPAIPATPSELQIRPLPGPSKRSHDDNALDLVKRRRIDKQTFTADDGMDGASTSKDYQEPSSTKSAMDDEPSSSRSHEYDNKPAATQSINDDEASTSKSSQSENDDYPSISKGDNPSTSKGDNPSTSKGDNPSTLKDDNPSTSKGDKPSTSNDDNPSTSNDDNPSTSKGDNPSTSKDDNPSTSKGDNLSTSKDDNLPTSNDDNPSTSNNINPSTSNDDNPSTSNDDNPSTSKDDKDKPSTSKSLHDDKPPSPKDNGKRPKNNRGNPPKPKKQNVSPIIDEPLVYSLDDPQGSDVVARRMLARFRRREDRMGFLRPGREFPADRPRPYPPVPGRRRVPEGDRQLDGGLAPLPLVEPELNPRPNNEDIWGRQDPQPREPQELVIEENLPPLNPDGPDVLQIPNEPQPGHQFVSDSSVLRFGRADNDNINYVHIGHNFNPNDPGNRPNRSNLRILSITGYRNITDRSLQHLATAAPHLERLDFSGTGISRRGIEMFTAMRPNCDVKYSKDIKP